MYVDTYKGVPYCEIYSVLPICLWTYVPQISEWRRCTDHVRSTPYVSVKEPWESVFGGDKDYFREGFDTPEWDIRKRIIEPQLIYSILVYSVTKLYLF